MNKNYLITLIIVSIIILNGCGGGGGGEINSTKGNSNSSSAEINNNPILQTVVIPDALDYYKDKCASPAIQFVIPVKLNNDNLQDFIVHYWCSQPLPWGREVTSATPDALVAQVSQPDGTYKVANEQIFGSKLYGLGGASRKFVRGDINGDGRDDFAFAMNWEDGRLASNPMTNATEPSVLMSQPDGGYRVVRLGVKNWNHSVEIVKNVSSNDVVFAGFVRDNQAFRYINGNFTDVSSEYNNTYSSAWASTFRAIADPITGVVTWFAGAGNQQNTDTNVYSLSEWGIRIFNKNGSVWTVLQEFWQKVSFTVNWISWQLTTGTNSVVTINSKQYFGGAYDEICVMPPLTSNGPRLLIAKMGAAQDIKGRTLLAGQTYSEQEATPVNIYNFFEIDSVGGLKQISSPIVNEETQSNFNFFDCKDINNDGFPDLVSYAFTRPGFNERVAEGGKPTIYINDKLGKLIKVDIGYLPKNTAQSELQSSMTDVNGDGIIDLLLYGSSTSAGGGEIKINILRSKIMLP
jgi:hypothetical protein